MTDMQHDMAQSYDYGTDGELLSVPREPKPIMDEGHSYSARSYPRAGKGLTIGLMVIALGVVLWLDQAGVDIGDHWWAIFPLIMGLSMLFSAIAQSIQTQGQQGGRRIISGLILTVVGIAFLFNINFKLVWPLFIVFVGIKFLMRSVNRR